ncbi:DUF881 domain-containing protein [Luteipulveratus flavus]|uniref:DUF881 domain-containing protein n=1 Tax=Luteipulveratus flavus TaxID=3031728 RepID=A0ABT6CBI4_9MICO|nr:DUF881 domain-containing protein [Luteipulveratus sp. YIM 133296]MDF8266255.1 DUF881 domain-containing protein [Luteipulveratus sp. YIM 133296]
MPSRKKRPHLRRRAQSPAGAPPSATDRTTPPADEAAAVTEPGDGESVPPTTDASSVEPDEMTTAPSPGTEPSSAERADDATDADAPAQAAGPDDHSDRTPAPERADERPADTAEATPAAESPVPDSDGDLAPADRPAASAGPSEPAERSGVPSERPTESAAADEPGPAVDPVPGHDGPDRVDPPAGGAADDKRVEPTSSAPSDEAVAPAVEEPADVRPGAPVTAEAEDADRTQEATYPHPAARSGEPTPEHEPQQPPDARTPVRAELPARPGNGATAVPSAATAAQPATDARADDVPPSRPEPAEPPRVEPSDRGPSDTVPARSVPADESEPSAWGRLGRMAMPRLTKGNLLAALLALALGFATVTQVRQTRTSGLENLRQSDLVSLLANVNNQSSRLDKDVRDLTRTRDGLKSGDNDGAALSAARDRLASLGILAGTVKATGPGIKIVVNDPDRAMIAANLLDTVQELRGAGAEAIQIGDARVVADSWFGTSKDGTLVVDGKPVRAPYTILAIGDSHTMSTAMAIPGGVVEQLKRIGAHPTVLELGRVEVTALRAVSDARYAQRDDQGK